MSAPSLRIGVDLDGVCYSFDQAHAQFLCDRYGMDMRSFPTPDRWNTWECWGITFDWWKRSAELGVDAGYIFRHGKPFLNTKWALDHLKASGHTIHIVTHRNIGKRSVENTVGWLQEQELPFDTLTFAEDKTIVDVDLFIEDNLANAEKLTRAGIPVVIRDQPWNRRKGMKHDTDWEHRFHRVLGWVGFVDLVEEIETEAERMAAALGL